MAPSKTSRTELAAAAQRETPLTKVFLIDKKIFVVVEIGKVFAMGLFLLI